MDWLNKTGILLTLITLFLMGCATSKPVAKGSFPSAIVPSTSPTSEENQLKCNAGELTTCITRYRVSDGRHGRKNNKGQNCMCLPESTVLFLPPSMMQYSQ